MGGGNCTPQQQRQECPCIFQEEYIFQILHPTSNNNDGGSHFGKKLFKKFLKKYGIRYNVETPYHPYTSGKVKLSNREKIKILARTVNANRTDELWNTTNHIISHWYVSIQTFI